jgi:hypothetical protein
MCDYQKKYQKYKKKYFQKKELLNGGNLFFLQNKGKYDLIKKDLNSPTTPFRQESNPPHYPSTFNAVDKNIIDLFVNTVLPCIFINGKRISPNSSNDAEYLSSGSFGATISVDKYVVKIINSSIVRNTEITYMAELSKYDMFCKLYCAITFNNINYLSGIQHTDYYDKFFQIYGFNNNAVTDKNTLSNIFSSLQSDILSSSTKSNLCFLIIEKGLYDVFDFYVNTIQMNMQQLISYTNISSVSFYGEQLTFNVSDDVINLKVVYFINYSLNVINAVCIMNIDENLLHCDIKIDNIMVMPYNKNTLPNFKLIDFGLTTRIANRNAWMNNFYTPCNNTEPPYIAGMNMFKTFGNVRYCTVLYDLYCSFLAFIQFFDLIRIVEDGRTGNQLFNITGTSLLLNSVNFPQFVQILLQFYSNCYQNIRSELLKRKFSTIFNVIIILSQIPEILKGSYDVKYCKIPYTNLYDQNAFNTTYRIDLTNPLTSLTNLIVLVMQKKI